MSRDNSITGYPIERFTEELDDFFICGLCQLVVRNPQECIECQGLFWYSCTLSAEGPCPFGCSVLQTQAISKFAEKCYLKLEMTCENELNGCNFTGTISEVNKHASECQYIMVCCQSEICDNKFLKSTAMYGQGLYCSELCQMINALSITLESKTQDAALLEIIKYIEITRTRIEEEVREEISSQIPSMQEQIEICKEITKERDQLLNELELRSSHYHPGKWVRKEWTCCKSSEMIAPGCREL